MTITSQAHTTTVRAVAPSRTLWRAGVASAVAAAAATTILALAARAAGAPLTIDGQPIPLAGFAQLTVVGALIGLGLAAGIRRWSRHPRLTFVSTTIALTALSWVPDLVVAASVGSKLTLMTTHVVAAAIVVPALASRLPRQ